VALFLAGAAIMLMVAVSLAHKLNHPSDTLGLRAARAAAAQEARNQ
jgi:hypothetical protein